MRATPGSWLTCTFRAAHIAPVSQWERPAPVADIYTWQPMVVLCGRQRSRIRFEKQWSRATNGDSRRAIRRLPLRLIEQCVEKTTDQTTAEFATYSRVRRQVC